MYGLEILRERVDRGAGYGLGISLERGLTEEYFIILRSLEREITEEQVYGLGISLERGLTEEQVIILRSLERGITVEQVYGLEILAGRINIGAGNVIIWTEIRWGAGGSCP